MNTKTILITGVTGFLGSNLAIELVSQGYKVVALKRKSSSLKRIETILPKIYLYDIENIDFLTFFQDIHKIDVVIHTATSYGRNNETPWEIFDANTSFPLKLLDGASVANVSKFINTDTILDKFLNLYSLSKNHLLDWGKFYSMRNRIEFINMRLEHFYGPGDDDSKFTSYVINNCISNTTSLKLTLGEQSRDFIYIDDVVSAYIAVLNREKLVDEYFSQYDVGSGKSVTIRKFVETVHKITESNINLEFGAVPYRVGEVMKSKANITALKELGWYCKFSLEEGLILTIKDQK
ncbi:NAD(P)-dependent oxidoreductase [Flavobacterium psychroterrae]|uniref:NAD(P)-dependent oxidoreductase n=1 Tax=Flavobacterium psychroterrae TaxID=2133767 RepID=A0ABS5PCA8_9FLAO|nr:NAD(P)-dependent oxidoreductase [Flavobacterium psychroterrae]MBS7231929.1 NAD(P)-dependent oxidoreductase [Flavobacterium psychroterrae]